MAVERAKEVITRIGDRLNEQVWFQQLKAKYEELDPQSRLYLKAAAAAGGVLIVVIMVVSSMVSLHLQKSDLAEKADLLNLINASADELRSLKVITRGARGSAVKPNWPDYLRKRGALSGK